MEWLGIAAGAAFLTWVVPRAGNWVFDAFAEKIISSLETRWSADIAADIDENLRYIREQLSANGGTTVKDLAIRNTEVLAQIQRDIEPLVNQEHKAWWQYPVDPPEGTEF